MEYRGTVQGNVKLDISFSGHDVDDVLKSLVFADQDQGHVRAVEYKPAPDAEEVAGNSLKHPLTLAQTLQQYRGEPIAVQKGELSFAGTIVAVENREYETGPEEVVVLLDKQHQFRSFKIGELDAIAFENPTLRDEYQLALRGVVKGREASRKKIELLFAGSGERRIAFAYVVDFPVWRMTYRLAIDEQDRFQLQGWCHINNLTGLDWKDVDLELRVGRPSSFHAELFAPLLAERPSVDLSVFGLAPELTLVSQWYGFTPPHRFSDSSRDEHQPTEDRKRGFGGFGGGGGIGGGGFGDGDLGGGATTEATTEERRDQGGRGIDIVSALRNAAHQDSTSQTTRFRLREPVSLVSGKSAALPVFDQHVPGRLVTLFRHDKEGNQYEGWRSVELKNESEFPYVTGPVSILRQGDFIGDGQLVQPKINQPVYLTYALDDQIHVVRTEAMAQEALVSLTIDDDWFRFAWQHRRHIFFDIVNESAEPSTVLLNYMIEKPADIDLPETDVAKTGPVEVWPELQPVPTVADGPEVQYDLPIAEKSRQRFSVTSTWTSTSRARSSTVTETDVQKWLASGANVSAEADRALRQLSEIHRQKLTVQSQIYVLEKDKAKAREELIRARENLVVLANQPLAANPYLERLNKADEQITTLDGKLEPLQRQLDALNTQHAHILETD